jgi:hypothetical protein
VRTVLGFTRLSSAAYAIIRRAVDEDDGFRARVAAAAEEGGEAGIGRAGWLWLHRPEGWQVDPSVEAGAEEPETGPALGRLRRERDGAEAAAARYRQAAEAAEEGRRRAVEQLAEVRRDAASASSRRAELEDRVDALAVERNRAVRAQKALEAELATARRDLRLAREATRQAEAELLAGRDGAVAPEVIGAATDSLDHRAAADPDRPAAAGAQPATTAPATAGPVGDAEPPIDRAAARDAVAAAAEAADLLARALADAAAVLAPTASEGDLAPGAIDDDGRAQDDGRIGAPARAADRLASARAARHRRPRSAPRAAVGLPPGVVSGTAEAHRHLVRAGALLVVDGYNVAREAWRGLAPEEERRRTVRLLEEVSARTGSAVTVVFDGDDATVAPAASRAVRVRFSATGQTADDAIADLVAGTPAEQPVVVVSSDREVADDARRQGAAVLGSRDFLAAAGR